MTQHTRRSFLKLFGAGIAAAAAPAIVEPERKLWFVPSNAPVGSRVERLTQYAGLEAWMPAEHPTGPIFGIERNASLRQSIALADIRAELAVRFPGEELSVEYAFSFDAVDIRRRRIVDGRKWVDWAQIDGDMLYELTSAADVADAIEEELRAVEKPPKSLWAGAPRFDGSEFSVADVANAERERIRAKLAGGLPPGFTCKVTV